MSRSLTCELAASLATPRKLIVLIGFLGSLARNSLPPQHSESKPKSVLHAFTSSFSLRLGRVSSVPSLVHVQAACRWPPPHLVPARQALDFASRWTGISLLLWLNPPPNPQGGSCFVLVPPSRSPLMSIMARLLSTLMSLGRPPRCRLVPTPGPFKPPSKHCKPRPQTTTGRRQRWRCRNLARSMRPVLKRTKSSIVPQVLNGRSPRANWSPSRETQLQAGGFPGGA